MGHNGATTVLLLQAQGRDTSSFVEVFGLTGR